MNEQKLKFLFKAELSDGSIFEQNPEDKSAIDPEKRSAFFDLLELTKTLDIVRFSIYDGVDTYLVDLTDGHFEVNGMKFIARSEQLPEDFPKFRIVFFRQHQHTFNVGYDELSHNVTYFIGWQTTINGKNYQQTIGVK